jgi:hypothetical protein
LISLFSEIYLILRFCDIISHLFPSFLLMVLKLCRISLFSELLYPQQKESLVKFFLFPFLSSLFFKFLCYPSKYTHKHIHTHEHMLTKTRDYKLSPPLSSSPLLSPLYFSLLYSLFSSYFWVSVFTSWFYFPQQPIPLRAVLRALPSGRKGNFFC